MRYDYSVIYNGTFYRAGENVPVNENKLPEGKAETTVFENTEEKAAEEEKIESEDTVTETKKPSKRRTKA